MNRLWHASQHVKEPLIWESEKSSNQLEPEVVSISSSCKSFTASNTTRNSPAGLPNSLFSLVAPCKSSTMDTCGTYANDGADLPATANSSSRTMIRPALTTPVHADSTEDKQTGRAIIGLEGAEVKSELGILDVQGDKHNVTRTAPCHPCGGLKTQSMERQAGHRSRFRPWGYI
ncbi:hypothetical protein BDR22DRAFT_823417 [Usnea florida]